MRIQNEYATIIDIGCNHTGSAIGNSKKASTAYRSMRVFHAGCEGLGIYNTESGKSVLTANLKNYTQMNAVQIREIVEHVP
jgi:hypothetical protein